MQDIVLISIPETTIRLIVENAVRRVLDERQPAPTTRPAKRGERKEKKVNVLNYSQND